MSWGQTTDATIALAAAAADATAKANAAQTAAEATAAAALAAHALLPTGHPTMVASGASHAPGMVPDPPAISGTTKFLREDATWAVAGGAASTIRLRTVAEVVADTTDIERHPTLPTVIRAATATSFDDVADMLAVDAATWEVVNDANATSAACSGGTAEIVHDTDSTDQIFNGTTSSPHARRAIVRQNDWLVIRFRMSGVTASGDSIRAGLLSSDGYTVAAVDFDDTGNTAFRTLSAASTATIISNVGDAPVLTGYWFEITVSPSQMASFRYSSQDVAEDTDVTTWTRIAATQQITNASTTWYEFFGAVRTSSGQATCRIKRWKTYVVPTGLGTPTPALSATGYPATGTAVVLGQVDEGSAVLPNIAAMRLVLADAANRLAGDSGGVLWALVGSDVSLADCTAPATMEAGAALDLRSPANAVISTATLYWKLWLQFTSTGSLLSASVDTALIPGIILDA